jgi:hypothetical protein
MPALDYENTTNEVAFDVSSVTEATTNAMENGRAGFSVGEGFVVMITEASTANFGTRTLNAFLDVSLDNGSTYYPIGVAALRVGTTGVPQQTVWAPCQKDIVPENYNPDNIQWRGRVTLSSTLSTTDDFNFLFALGNQDIGLPPGLRGNGIS